LTSRRVTRIVEFEDFMATEREFDVVLEAAEEGGFVVSVPSLPGCWTQGETREAALANAKEAIRGYVETLEELGKPLPEPQREHVTLTA
jgi:predicted RNase H-like HicB family nuclease